MRLTKPALLMSVTLCGCSTFDSGLFNYQSDEITEAQQYEEESQAYLMHSESAATMSPLEASASFQKYYQGLNGVRKSVSSEALQQNVAPKVRNINHYVRGIMQDLVGNLQSVGSSTPMAVSSFVFLDSDFVTSNLLGNQIAESFIHEIHKFGIPVIDFKTTDNMRVTESGDFVLSRDFLDLQPDLPIKYVLVGTLTKHLGGVLVNARIVGMESKAVVASAQGFLPAKVSDALLNSDLKNEVNLVKG